jgi:hypothetical protein
MPDIIGDQSRPRLHVRTVLGAAGSPAAGKTGYLYRLDLTNVIGALDVSCATALKLDVGPTAKFEYFKNGANADLFVIDKGGAGTIGVSKAERIGSGITVTFRKSICVGDRAEGRRKYPVLRAGLRSSAQGRQCPGHVDRRNHGQKDHRGNRQGADTGAGLLSCFQPF